MSASAELIIFSDLDGCLLDRSTYDWKAARPGVELVKRHGIPLVLCSSKTQPEMEFHRQQLGLGDPFAVENGGAVFIPPGCFSETVPGAQPRGSYQVVEFGVAYARLVEALRDIGRHLSLILCGFAEMTPEKVAQLTGLDPDAACRAKARQYDEPFVAELSRTEVERLDDEVRRRGLTLIRGGRLYHLTGQHTKGLAVEVLTRLYRSHDRQATTVGLGDGPNDLSLLERVDIPVVVPKAPSTIDPVFHGRPWTVAPTPGPAGWTAAIQAVLGGNYRAPARCSDG